MPSDGNRLGGEASPYLIQHAGNPVHWRPWGAEALAEAKRRDCPILLSVGYAACHWCHVMAHESFEDSETAALMNRLFVNVKVDREERPDIDQIYMSALHAMGEQGGWPLTIFLTPGGAPIYGGTYWPPAPRWGRPSFRQVLQAVDDAWRNKREAMLAQGASLVAHLTEIAAPRPGPDLAPEDLTRVGEALLRLIDPINGGVGDAPKFPNAPIFRFLWSEFFRRADGSCRAAVRGLIDALCAGGVYDHLGGGFARYSTDAQWRVPHFEKMLYDNAQILELLALAHAETPMPVYAARAHETFEWLMREMRSDDAFAASQDADSEGEEGRFYVWSAAEIDSVLGEGAAAFKAAYDVRAGGNWEGRNVLRRVTPPGDAAAEARLGALRARLFAEREKRVRPARDDKILADWNGLAIAALARSSAVFDAPECLDAARAAFAFVTETLREGEGGLVHAWRAGRASAAGMLDDYAAMARAALSLFEATGEPHDLEAATQWAEAAQNRFGDEDGGFYLTARDAQGGLIVRPRPAHDGVTPSGVSLMAEVFARLHLITDEARWREAAERLFRAASGPRQALAQNPLLLAAADLLERGAVVVVQGPLDDPGAVALARAALAAPDPATCVVRIDRALWPRGAPGAKPPLGAAPAAMVCRSQRCGLPVTDVEALRAELTLGFDSA
ncbi:MAG: thioredoxin domain-containing protein [Roseiarcus sp.]|jgi:uncharacterized protein YyaL (SSP411 family)